MNPGVPGGREPFPPGLMVGETENAAQGGGRATGGRVRLFRFAEEGGRYGQNSGKSSPPVTIATPRSPQQGLACAICTSFTGLGLGQRTVRGPLKQDRHAQR